MCESYDLGRPAPSKAGFPYWLRAAGPSAVIAIPEDSNRYIQMVGEKSLFFFFPLFLEENHVYLASRLVSTM
jgi:hypothetical protein